MILKSPEQRHHSLQCPSAYRRLIRSSQPPVTASPPLTSAGESSDLRQRDLVGVCVALNVQDEGIFIGVVLDDVIVHIHQDPDTNKHWMVNGLFDAVFKV